MGLHPAAIILPIAIFAALPAQSSTLSFSGKASAGNPGYGEGGYCYDDCTVPDFPLGEGIGWLTNVLIDYSYRVWVNFINWDSEPGGYIQNYVEEERAYNQFVENRISGSIGLVGWGPDHKIIEQFSLESDDYDSREVSLSYESSGTWEMPSEDYLSLRGEQYDYSCGCMRPVKDTVEWGLFWSSGRYFQESDMRFDYTINYEYTRDPSLPAVPLPSSFFMVLLALGSFGALKRSAKV